MWVFLTILSALVQNTRFMLQKQLADTALSPAGATYARFFWSAPVMALVLSALLVQRGLPFPEIDWRFGGYVLAGAISQIIATIFVIQSFSYRNFAIGMTLKRTDTILSALVGIILLGDYLPLQGWVFLAFGFIGVFLMSKAPKDQGGSLFNKGSALALGAGMFFGISAVAYRGGSLS